MKGALNFLSLLLFAATTVAQPSLYQWDHVYGGSGSDSFYRMKLCSDHGFIIGGVSNSPVGFDIGQPNRDPSGITNDYWIVKTDSLGVKQWAVRLGGTSDDLFYDLIECSSGGYLLGGYSLSSAGADKTDSARGITDYWVIRLDENGNKLWDKTYGGWAVDNLTTICETYDGHFLIGGNSLSSLGADKTEPTWGGWDYWILKIDTSGNKVWDKRYGGALDDNIYSISISHDSAYVLAGFSQSYPSGNKTQPSQGVWDYWIVKIDGSGNVLWDKTYGGDLTDFLFDHITCSDGGFLLHGTSQSNASGDKSDSSRGFWDYWIVRLDALGNKLWDKTYGGSMEEDAYAVEELFDKGYLISGTSYSPAGSDKSENNLGVEQIWLVRTDSMGNKLWDKTIFTNGHDENGMATVTHDGCIANSVFTEASVGGYKMIANYGLADYWLMKLCFDANVSVLDIDKENEFIFPNPATDYIRIEIDLAEIESIQIFDVSGQQVMHFNGKLIQHNQRVSIQHIPKGFYFIQINKAHSKSMFRCIKM